MALFSMTQDDDYASRKAAIARQEKLAEMLSQMGAQEQAVSTAGGITAPMSPMGALARGLTSFGGSYLSGKAAADEAGLKKSGTEELVKAVSEFGAPYKTTDQTAPAEDLGGEPIQQYIMKAPSNQEKMGEAARIMASDLPGGEAIGSSLYSNVAKQQSADIQNAKLLAPYAKQMSTFTPEMQALANADPTTFIKTIADISIKKTEPAKSLEGENKHVADYVKNHPNMPVGQAELAGRREWALAGHVASSSDTNPGFQQAQSAFMLPDGTKVTPIFDKHRGYGTLDGGKFTPLPKGARPVTLGAGGPMPMVQVVKLKQDFINEDTALNRMNRYFKTVGDADVGIARWADKVAGNARTAFGSKTLSPEQLTAQVGQGQLQGLLGLFRTDIVGPGVMTEYDAERVISALGGDFSNMQNPAVVKQMLTDLYQDKQRRLDAYQADINYNKPYYSTLGFPSRTSSTSLGGDAPAAPAAPGGAGGHPSDIQAILNAQKAAKAAKAVGGH